MTTMNDPLGGFIAEVESGAGLHASDPESDRYNKLCREAQLDIDRGVPPHAAAMASSTILNYRGNMPPNQNGILYFDTEQSTYHAFRVFKRIARLTRKSNHEIKERIKYFALRKYSVEDRIGMIDPM